MFAKYLKLIKLEKNFRCKCANTWKNTHIVLNQNYCKSLQYNNISGRCTLNNADHNGKFDLIIDKSVDYYYVSCSTSGL